MPDCNGCNKFNTENHSFGRHRLDHCFKTFLVFAAAGYKEIRVIAFHSDFHLRIPGFTVKITTKDHNFLGDSPGEGFQGSNVHICIIYSARSI